MNRLMGKIALVTGGGRGIGRAIAKRLAAEGAIVAVHYGANRDAAEQTVRDIAEAGGRAFPVGAPEDPGAECAKAPAAGDAPGCLDAAARAIE